MLHSTMEMRQSIDLMRIVAAFGIVWFHLQAPGPILGILSLPLFLMLAGALSVGSVARRGGVAFWRGRVSRLLGPWLAWSGVYLLADAHRFGWRAVLTLDDPLTLLIGPSIHLWFLPFAALVSGLAVAAAAWLTTPARVRLAAALLAGPCALAVLPLDRHLLAEPFAQWSVALAPFIYGVLFASGRAHGAPGAALGFAAAVAAVAWWGWGARLAPILPVAALLFEGIWRLDLRHPWLPALGRLSYAIYFAHPLCALAWHSAGGTTGAAGAVAVFLASAGLALALDAAFCLSGADRAAAPPAREPA